MRIARKEVPTRLDVPGAVARQQLDFGDATGYRTMAGEYFSLKKGTDIAPLLKGLAHDACHAPHWGYMLEGKVLVSYADGRQETTVQGDLFYWPPGHSVRVEDDAEIVLFSPQAEHCAVMEHMKKKLGA